MENIKNIIKNRKGKSIEKLTKCAVMILLVEERDDLYIVFEKRSMNLNRQPGDISLPGGIVEFGEMPRESAIRETQEELNIKIDNLEYIGEGDYFISPYNSIIYSFVSKLTNYDDIKPNKDEVDHVFKVPLKYFLENEPIKHEVEVGPNFKEDFPFNLIVKGKNYKFSVRKYDQYFYCYNDYVIWGYTVRIIKNFIDLINHK